MCPRVFVFVRDVFGCGRTEKLPSKLCAESKFMSVFRLRFCTSIIWKTLCFFVCVVVIVCVCTCLSVAFYVNASWNIQRFCVTRHSALPIEMFSSIFAYSRKSQQICVFLPGLLAFRLACMCMFLCICGRL